MTPQQIDHLRASLAEAHRCVIVAQNEPGHSPTEDALLCAIHAIGSVCATLVDVVEQMNERLPMTEAEFSALMPEETK